MDSETTVTASMGDGTRAEIIAELEAKQAELEADLARLTAPIDSDSTIGFGKRIGDGTTQAIGQMEDAAIAQSLATVLDQVKRARAKLDEGSYGQCDVCGRPIGAGRLEFRAWSTTCIDHA